MTKVKYGLIEAMQLLATNPNVKKVMHAEEVNQELYLEDDVLCVGSRNGASTPLRHITDRVRTSLWYIEWKWNEREAELCTFEQAYRLVDCKMALYAERIQDGKQRALVANASNDITIRLQQNLPGAPSHGKQIADIEVADITGMWRVHHSPHHKMFDVVVIHARSDLSEKEVITKTDTTYAEALLSLSEGFEPFTAVGFVNGRPETIIEVTELGDVY